MSSTDRTRDRSPTSNDGKRSPERIGNGGHRSLSDMRVEALRRAAPELSSAPPSTHKQWDNTLKLYRNENGGIAIDEDEIQAAFNFLDINETGEIDKATLQRVLGCFFKSWSDREYNLLMSEFGGKVTAGGLKDLLIGNELANFDPIREAFKVYDPLETGFMSTEILRNITESLGHGTISQDDLDSMIYAADVDGDSRVSLEDFRSMLLNKGRKAGPGDRSKSE
eukprot:TRINITY_DN8265_c0_g1_i2.p1 TRINITY_DN8265_c0_g1~~TRINITY_DN8265_c0_g1_i2.p1  ORF type:complete len:224 (+),score=63.43 TRINITY_DN8265_c0_g1_i2:43-714(+)